MAIELRDFDAAEFLDTEEALGAFIREAFETGDSDHITRALGIAARAEGMKEMAKATGLSRGTLYKALKPGGNPRLDTLLKVTGHLGINLTTKSGSIDAVEKTGRARRGHRKAAARKNAAA